MRFAFDGTGYEIDLNTKNATAFGNQLAPYLQHAQQGRAGTDSPARAGRSRPSAQR